MFFLETKEMQMIYRNKMQLFKRLDHFKKNRDLFETFSGSIKFRSTVTRHKKKINIINLS
jgi:hypothetical protein